MNQLSECDRVMMVTRKDYELLFIHCRDYAIHMMLNGKLISNIDLHVHV